jgi:aspartyl-tRNA(Asn)/glutamyl-tRNA(Gln) amidotransferase subunit A
MTDFSRLGVAAIRDGVAKGEFKAVEVAEALNARVSAAKALNAFIVETPEKAIEAAQAVDADRVVEDLGRPASDVEQGVPEVGHDVIAHLERFVALRIFGSPNHAL